MQVLPRRENYLGEFLSNLATKLEAKSLSRNPSNRVSFKLECELARTFVIICPENFIANLIR